MRFRFCGDLDCPDWVLSGINLLSRLSSLKLRTMCTMVMKNLLGDELDMEKLQKTAADAKLEEAELRACVAVLSFTLESAVRHDASSAQLGQELQQLGLPREHATSAGKVLEQHSQALAERQRRQSLKLPGFERLDWDLQLVRDSTSSDPSSGQVSSDTPGVSAEAFSAQVALTLQPEVRPQSLGDAARPQPPPLQLLLDLPTAAVCRRELRLARQRMEDVS